LNTLKRSSVLAPVLALPNFNKPFILESDATDKSIGAVLMQEGKPISYFSKSLGKQAVEFSTYDKEALAIIEALKKWKHYLAKESLILRNDQQSLKHIAYQKLIQGIQHKLLIKLMGYNYRIKYKKGRENKVADSLSRRPHTESV
jgi:hypothetical protein